MEYLAPRIATHHDLDIAVRHRSAMFADMGHHRNAEFEAMTKLSAPWFRSHIADGSYIGYLIETAGSEKRVVAGGGVLFLDWPPTYRDPQSLRGYILNIYVEPDHRRRGLARIVTNACLEACRARGIRTVSLHAATAARPLYEQMGFASTNEMRLDLGVRA
jgi:ribosomal protein S18 acetylase RimI-like enzyme